MRLLLRSLVFSGIIVLAAHPGCFAQKLEREQGPYQPKPAAMAKENFPQPTETEVTHKPADSRASPVRLKKIEEKMKQVDAIKQKKVVENTAIDHFQQGEVLYREGKKKEADVQWMQAIELSKDPAWMKRTINDAKRKAQKDAKEKRLTDKAEKKKRAAEEKQKKKLERLRQKEEKRRQKLITFNQKPAKFFPIKTKPKSTLMDLSKPPKTGVAVQ